MWSQRRTGTNHIKDVSRAGYLAHPRGVTVGIRDYRQLQRLLVVE